MVFDNYVCEEQMSIFDFTHETFKIDKPIRLIELFAGVGSQAMALEELEADFEHYRVVEFDKYAIESYNAIHGTDFPTMDITKVQGKDLGIVDTDEYCYILTYSFPCQDLSVAGKGKGMSKGSGTRSGLLWEVERLLNEVDNLPQVLVMENVPMVHGEGNKKDFQKWIEFLESKGYSNWYEDMNAKNYGVAQSRDRCFMVSILGDYHYKFPKPIPLTKKMKDYLEEELDEKYYINSEKAQELIDKLIVSGEIQKQSEINELGYIERGTGQHQSNTVYGTDGVCPCQYAGQWRESFKIVEDKTICRIVGRNPENPTDRTVGIPTEQRLEPNSEGICNCLTSVQKDNMVLEVQALDEQNMTIRPETVGTLTTDGSSPKHNNRVLETVRIREATKKGYAECKIGGVADLLYPTSTTRRGRVQDMGDTCPTIVSGENGLHRIEFNPYYLSDKGKKYVCDPKRGMCTDINADVCQTLTATGQSNWTGSFVSPDIRCIEKSTQIGSNQPTKIHLMNGDTVTSNDNLSMLRIRKLTPKECWRLMDFKDEDFEKAAKVNSNTQLYKQAGNSIVKNCLVAIFGQMIPGKENVYKERFQCVGKAEKKED